MPTLYSLDQQQLQRNFSRAAAYYDTAAVLQREVAARMLERLQLMRSVPDVIVDIGCGTGYTTAALLKKYRRARVIALDIAPPMLQLARRRAPWWRTIHPVCADAALLPLADASCDMLFSNLMLHWCTDPDRLLSECRRVLKPGGLLMFSTLGPDTLIELRRSWAAADDYRHVHLFFDMHDIGDALLRAQLADPVMDTEYFTLTYASVRSLLSDLRQLGAVNIAADRARGLTGKRRFRTMTEFYERLRRDGVLPATFEVSYGHAWAPLQTQAPATKRADGSVVVPLSQLRRSRD